MEEKKYFQEHLSDNICFGCGNNNPDGLQIKSYWDGDESVCIWNSSDKYQGWPNVMNGGIMATVIDCHCMNTAMAAAYKHENRSLDSEPQYRYATGTMNIRYLKPTANNSPLEVRAKVTKITDKKVVVQCITISKGVRTSESKVVAIRVFDSSADNSKNIFNGM